MRKNWINLEKGMSEKKGLWKLYSVVDGKLVRKATFCPVCGVGYIMAEHEDRYTCGRCGYTSFKKKQPQK